MKVLVADKFAPEGLAILEEAAGIELAYHPGLTDDELFVITSYSIHYTKLYDPKKFFSIDFNT